MSSRPSSVNRINPGKNHPHLNPPPEVEEDVLLGSVLAIESARCKNLGLRCHSTQGFTLVELLVTLVIFALVMVSLNGLLSGSLEARETAQRKNALSREARFAMERITTAVERSPRLILPMVDDPGTGQDESVRDVLTVLLDPTRDLDNDGTADADNDEDGRVDEDLPGDTNNDFAAGVRFIDDDNDGATDVPLFGSKDDDEEGSLFPIDDEDPINGLDDDGDGSIDEDPGADMNGDGAPGVAGVDDDVDGSTDEGDVNDDDEDGAVDEDWWDTVSFYLQSGNVIERTPVPWDETGVGGITGRDYVESTLVENVTDFRVERIPQAPGHDLLLDITLELTDPEGDVLSLNTQIRVGGAL